MTASARGLFFFQKLLLCHFYLGSSGQFGINVSNEIALPTKTFAWINKIYSNLYNQTTSMRDFAPTVLQKLLLQITEDWHSTRNSWELRIMETNARFSRLVSIISISLANATFITQGIIAFLKVYAHNRLSAGLNETSEWPLYMRASFPYDVQRSPSYELTLVGQLFSNFFAASTYTSIDSLFIVLMLHVCGQLSILRLKLINVTANSEGRGGFARRIAFIHQRHGQLTR